MDQPVSRADLLKELLPGLNKLFGIAYDNYKPTDYVRKCRYGKYTIYKWEYVGGERKSSTLARGLTKKEADGFLKLLKEEE